jgi:type III secretory pathway lipoprotein EscJ
MHGLSEREANSLITQLGDSGIEAEKLAQGSDSWSVQVEPSVVARAIKIISRYHSMGEKSVEEEQSGLFLSKEERKFQFARSVARDIEQTLVVLYGVHEAKVHLKFSEEDPLLAGFGNSSLGQAGNQGSGSVLVIVESDDLYKREDIANLVSGASGIPAERIAVWLTIDKVAVGNYVVDQESATGSSAQQGSASIQREPRPFVQTSPVQTDLISADLIPADLIPADLIPAQSVESRKGWKLYELALVTKYIRENFRMVLGLVFLTLAVIGLVYLRITRVKTPQPVIPSYVP